MPTSTGRKTTAEKAAEAEEAPPPDEMAAVVEAAKARVEAGPALTTPVAGYGENDVLGGTYALDVKLTPGPPRNVAEALSRVIGDLPAIGKDERMTQGMAYNYRGIEQITGHASILFAKHGVVVTPRVLSYDILERGTTGKGAAIDEARVLMEYTFHHGASDTSIVTTTLGVGRDSSDKAVNKAMTAAFKYALMQSLMVADKKDDQDADRPEVDSRQNQSQSTGQVNPPAAPPPGPPPPPEDEEHKALIQKAKSICSTVKNVNGAEGPYTVALREEAARVTGGKGVIAWCNQDPEGAYEFAKIQSDLMMGATAAEPDPQQSFSDVPPPSDDDR